MPSLVKYYALVQVHRVAVVSDVHRFHQSSFCPVWFLTEDLSSVPEDAVPCLVGVYCYPIAIAVHAYCSHVFFDSDLECPAGLTHIGASTGAVDLVHNGFLLLLRGLVLHPCEDTA